MRFPTRAASAAALAAALTAAAGCGAPTGQATGKVTVGGQPVAGAEVGFESADDPKRQAFGTTTEGGAYTLSYPDGKGLAAGKYAVAVTRYTLPNGNPLPPGEKGAALRAEQGKVVAKTYYFEAELRAGANALNFELKDGKDRKPGG